MSVPYKLLYRVGLTPWERRPMVPAAEQISALFDREDNGRGRRMGRRSTSAAAAGSGLSN